MSKKKEEAMVLELFGKYSFVIITSYLVSIILVMALILQSLLGKWVSERKIKEREESVKKPSK